MKALPDEETQSAYTEAINRLLSSTRSALLLAQAFADNRIDDSIRPQVLVAAMARPEPQVRDLFERFIPDDQRVKRLEPRGLISLPLRGRDPDELSLAAIDAGAADVLPPDAGSVLVTTEPGDLERVRGIVSFLIAGYGEAAGAA